MDKESTELILQHLDKLGDKLGVAADKVWPWFIKQVYIDAIALTVLLIVIITITYFYFKYLISLKESNNDPLWVTGFVLMVLLSISLLVTFLCITPRIFNPEYHALINLMNHIK